jgi:hypothetical protein
MWADIPALLNGKNGSLWNSDTQFVWMGSDEAKKLLEGGLDMKLVNIAGIGCYSGIEGDPLTSIARPGQLGKNEQKVLMDAELKTAELNPDSGRYMLCVALKNSQ